MAQTTPPRYKLNKRKTRHRRTANGQLSASLAITRGSLEKDTGLASVGEATYKEKGQFARLLSNLSGNFIWWIHSVIITVVKYNASE